MPETISLAELTDEAAVASLVERVVESLRKGEVIVLPMEHAYVFACDAFAHDAVAKIHTLRGDPYGTAAQVLIGSLTTLDGISQNTPEELHALADKFWPGLLTLQVTPHMGLNWDLGDHGELSEFAVRIPNQDFVIELLKKSGPLAMASAALAGRPAISAIDQIIVLHSDISFFLDHGTLPDGPASTVVRYRVHGHEAGVEVIRVGAISLSEMADVVPEIASPTTD
jgi:tRNA threonylcarbamoyl adenosine modification protein (Sua5/YciO/YrdC/YwlC family)